MSSSYGFVLELESLPLGERMEEEEEEAISIGTTKTMARASQGHAAMLDVDCAVFSLSIEWKLKNQIEDVQCGA